ncbi:MAG TPA: MFS transporter [Porticoccaceae bacterium]|nr:MFS transporter [Porticoccaceae bacterium]HCO60408.1 MFS transporter [Porticoccaceae bacterium]
MNRALQQYGVVTASYWGFTLTDGALRMLVVLYFHQLGYSPLAIASLFLFYELFGIITNLLGGWLAARTGLNTTLHIGLGLQILALSMLLVDAELLSVAYVMAAQAISGIAKDLNKMSAKSSIKLLLPDDQQGRLYRWVAILTGSKNALKGAGYFLGGLLLASVGFRGALAILLGGLAIVCIASFVLLDRGQGKSTFKPKFRHLWSKSSAINRLSAARFFLFGARDIWFVVALPVFLQSELGWSHTSVGILLGVWIIGYGAIQSLSPLLTGIGKSGPNARTLLRWSAPLCFIPIVLVVLLSNTSVDPASILVSGLLIFGAFFAVNSAIHSYLIVARAQADGVSLDVGFYYMANAGGRLCGTLLSGLLYQAHGLESCLLASSAFLIATSGLAFNLHGYEQGRLNPKVEAKSGL